MTTQPGGTIENVTVCTADEAIRVQEHVVASMQAQGFPQADVFSVRLALEEALTNALEHGNRRDPTKQVRLAYRVDPERVVLEVEDQGSGFCPEQVSDPTLPENVTEPNGRGLFFIRRYMCSIEYNETGNRLTMLKRRSRDESPRD